MFSNFVRHLHRRTNGVEFAKLAGTGLQSLSCSRAQSDSRSHSDHRQRQSLKVGAKDMRRLRQIDVLIRQRPSSGLVAQRRNRSFRGRSQTMTCFANWSIRLSADGVKKRGIIPFEARLPELNTRLHHHLRRRHSSSPSNLKVFAYCWPRPCESQCS